MAANNEIGTIQPLSEIGRLVREIRASGQKIWFHTDAVQAVGKMPVDVEEIGCDLLSLSAHKIYAAKRHRSTLCPSRNTASSAEPRRSPGTRRSRRDRICCSDRGFGAALRKLPELELLTERRASWQLRDRLEQSIAESDRRHRVQRRPRKPSAEYLEHLVSPHRGRRPAHQPRYAGHRRLDRFGMLVRLTRAFAGHPCHRPRRRTRPRSDPL